MGRLNEKHHPFFKKEIEATKGETLRMKVRDAIRDFLGSTEKAHITSEHMELEHDLADAVFEALNITEFEQDEYTNVCPIDPRTT